MQVIPYEVINTIKQSVNVAIYAHKRPDGDCLGSASALKGALLKLGKKVDLFCDVDELSQNYTFIKYMDKLNKPECEAYDLAIAVDCSDEARFGKYWNDFLSIENTLKIDHHKTSENFAKINFVELLGSNCEILYYVIKELGVEIDSDIACSLYVGLATDTGGFLHNNVTGNTHKIAGELIDIGFDIDTANYNLFKRRTTGQLALLKKALNNIKYICDGKVAITYLTKKDFTEIQTKNTETFGIVDILVNLDTVDVGILISEDKPNLYTCSLRSKGKVDVSEICIKFGGGGHIRAAGCNIFGGYKTVINKIEKVLNEYYARIS